MDNPHIFDKGRRRFLQSAFAASVTLPLFPPALTGCNGGAENQTRQLKIIGGACDGCELIYEGMPHELNWETQIAPPAEPGERLEISGLIFQSDGKTPAPNIILYVYHTDAQGYYSPAQNQPEASRRHGHLRGWMKTNARGEYRFLTIKPAPYPKRYDPAHIHPLVKEPDKNEYYIDEFRFDDDPLLTQKERDRSENRGGSGIIQLTKNSNGVWQGSRNITLGLNIPAYR